LCERKYCELFTHESNTFLCHQCTQKRHSDQSMRKIPKTFPSIPTCDVNSHLIDQSRAHFTYHPKPQLDRRSLYTLLHSYATKSPLVAIGRPISTPKLPLPVGGMSPQLDTALPWIHPTHHTKRHLDRLNHHITIHYSDRPTDRLTDSTRNMVAPTAASLYRVVQLK